jgi:hypothetical protein
MKLKTTFLALLLLFLIALSGIWIFYSLTPAGQTPAQTFPAIINRDCAPWDGGAFTMSFRYDPITTITISIWQSPSFPLPITFSFPDETRKAGTVYAVQELDPLEELTGKVTFWRVEQGIPVEGEFNLNAASGKHFKGKFRAEWGNEIVYCG